jgi:hypothetical protein
MENNPKQYFLKIKKNNMTEGVINIAFRIVFHSILVFFRTKNFQ